MAQCTQSTTIYQLICLVLTAVIVLDIGPAFENDPPVPMTRRTLFLPLNHTNYKASYEHSHRRRYLDRENAPIGTDVTNAYVHVVLSTDKRTLPGLLAAIRSLLVNTKEPDLIRLYVICAPGEGPLMRKIVSCLMNSFPNTRFTNQTLGDSVGHYQVVEFRIEDYHPGWKIAYREASGADRSAPNNYARMYFHKLLRRPDLVDQPFPNKVVYLDTDVIVQDDIATLFRESLVDTDYPIALPSRQRTLHAYSIRFNHPVLRAWNKEHAGTMREVKESWIAYNNGICVVHLQRWEDYGVAEDIDFWIKANIQTQLYNFSFNPPFLLGLYNRIEPINSAWNFDGLGYKNRYSVHNISKGKILHWNGGSKGWKTGALYARAWKPYNSNECIPRKYLGRDG